MRTLFRALKQGISYLSLKYKLFILLVMISIIPITIVSYSSQSFMFKSSRQYSSSISSQYVQFVSQGIGSYLQELSQSFDVLSTNSDFQKYMETPNDDLVAQANYKINFQPILSNVLQLHNELLGILYLDQRGKIDFESYQKRLDFNYPFQQDPFYTSILEKHNQELSIPHSMNYILGTKENISSFIRPIYNLRTGKITAWIILEIKEEKIKSMLSGAEYKNEGLLLLYDSKSKASVSSINIGSALLQDFRDSVQADAGQQKEFIFNSSGIRYEATYADVLPNSDWKLVWMAPLSSITKGVQQSTHLTMLITAVSLIISLIIAFPIMNIVLRPLYKLKGGMASLGRGAYIPIQIQHGNDEIGFLIQSYNRMLNELQKMEEEVLHSKLKEKERELLQLQAQINPHFLFNTLETIESYATKNNGEAVGEMVQSVSRMMRYNVRNDNGWAPLEEEINYIRNFLKIHHYRNGMDVMAKFDLDPAVMGISIMKLSIQPFVENAIKYGWSPQMSAQEFTLTVKAELKEDALHIIIDNTGTGISAEILHKLSQLIHSKGEIIDPYFQQHTGIYNVYRRFLLAYGDRTRLSINALPDRGTSVQINIPYRHQDDL